MTFAQTQLRQLKRQLDRRSIKHREFKRRDPKLHRGLVCHRRGQPDLWLRWLGPRDGCEPVRMGKAARHQYGAAYLTRVRITVRAGDQRVVREGSGTGEATAASPGLAHEFAAKAAETDATKRALSTFGNRFGLSLYGGSPDVGSSPTIRDLPMESFEVALTHPG